MADDKTTQGDATSPESDPGASATPPGRNPDDATSKGNGEGQGAKPDTELGDNGKAALDRERDARREAERNVARLSDRVNELEDAGKSEVEKAQAQHQRAIKDLEAATARVKELEGELSKRDMDALKAEVAAEHGLPPSVAKRLQGTNKRELTSDAKSLAEELHTGTRPGDLGLGRGGAASGRTRGTDMNTAIRQAAGR